MPSDWEDYFQPGTITATGNGVLRNKPGFTEGIVLHVYEYQVTAARQSELARDPSIVEHTFDAAHLRAIHGYLFQDVYDWAGEYRTVNMGKPGAGAAFADCDHGHIDVYLEAAQIQIDHTDWPAVDHATFVRDISTVYAMVNQAHPFREGNGRSAKVFLEHVAATSSFQLDWSQVGRDEWNQAAEASRPVRDSFEVQPEALGAVFSQVAVDRREPLATAEDTQPSPHSLSYPHRPRAATSSWPATSVNSYRGYGQGDPGLQAER